MSDVNEREFEQVCRERDDALREAAKEKAHHDRTRESLRLLKSAVFGIRAYIRKQPRSVVGCVVIEITTDVINEPDKFAGTVNWETLTKRVHRECGGE